MSGPSYSGGFKVVATLLTVLLTVYGASVVWRFPMLSFGLGVKALLALALLMLGVSYYWFLARTTIDAMASARPGCTTSGSNGTRCAAKMIGIPYMGWLFPPRMVVRTGNAFMTFNGGTQEVLIEFMKISLAFQAKK
ncbi:hypothetical protein LP420_19840 [Massilia sp. B-10]|nr:hypothetical protein LP420_19840 [Massilia sp. B-10]